MGTGHFSKTPKSGRPDFGHPLYFNLFEHRVLTYFSALARALAAALAFAVAAHLEPEILIVDEVLAVGDAEFQKKCLGKMIYMYSK